VLSLASEKPGVSSKSIKTAKSASNILFLPVYAIDLASVPESKKFHSHLANNCHLIRLSPHR
jgi:hypothetical protein